MNGVISLFPNPLTTALSLRERAVVRGSRKKMGQPWGVGIILTNVKLWPISSHSDSITSQIHPRDIHLNHVDSRAFYSILFDRLLYVF
jgi:hypothetical protein